MSTEINFPDDIKAKYKGMPLIVTTYSGANKRYYTIEDIKKFDNLSFYLSEVSDGEAYITSQGFKFLEEYFGLEKLAKLICTEGWYSSDYETTDEILEFLEFWRERSKQIEKYSLEELIFEAPNELKDDHSD